jgi:hypothetical protein
MSRNRQSLEMQGPKEHESKFIYISHLSIACLTMDIDRNMSPKRSNLRSTIQQWIAPWDSEGSPRYRRIFLKGIQAGEIHPSLLLHEGISGYSRAYGFSRVLILFFDIKPYE